MTISNYTADRAADNSRNRTDEDRAMAYELVYKGTGLAEARNQLADYMKREAEYLRRHNVDRADAIDAAVSQVADLDPENGRQASIIVAGIVYAIFRRDAA